MWQNFFNCIYFCFFGIILIIKNVYGIVDEKIDNAVGTQSYVIELTNENFFDIRNKTQVLFVAFSAEWCYFSKKLKPIFADAAKYWHTNNPGSNVVWGIVDSVKQEKIASSFGIEKYPTLKVFIYGVLMTYEFRSSRTVEELNNFVNEQLKSHINEFDTKETLMNKFNKDKHNIFIYMDCTDCLPFKNLKKISSFLRKNCDFWATNQSTTNSIIFMDPISSEEKKYNGDISDYESVKKWITDNCVPLIREVTFENVEELTEENLPFLLLFRNSGDKINEKRFVDAVKRELHDQRSLINPLFADGKKFSHPLKHLGKTAKDLPVIAIDSFKHMFLFENMDDLDKPNKLRQFVLDLHSGKLHTRFHETINERIIELSKKMLLENGFDIDREHENDETTNNTIDTKITSIKQTTLPESIFKELKPSQKRYSLLNKIEL